MAGCKNKRQTKGPTIKKATTYDISETNVKTGLIRACNVSACTERNFVGVANRLIRMRLWMWNKGCSNDLKYNINFLNNSTKLYKVEIFIGFYIYFKFS